jgi:ABC-type nitrate/sulfonate/bicarbonate transport system ATPase subunit
MSHWFWIAVGVQHTTALFIPTVPPSSRKRHRRFLKRANAGSGGKMPLMDGHDRMPLHRLGGPFAHPIIPPSSNRGDLFVFQHNGLLPWMTVWENVGLGLRHMPDPQVRVDRIREHIEMVELEGFEHHYPHQLSGGMQRRAELARALAVNPEILIMDEPFSGLDFLTHMKMREEVVNMHEFIGKTTIVVTHDIDDALITGDRIVVMGERPARVKMDQVLNFSRPRDFQKDPELNKLRRQIFLMLGVAYAV